ncbi:MAG: serine/threonine-protein kinase [Myxococcaceae bacterium]
MGATLRREPSSSGMTGEAVAPEVMTEGGRLGRFIIVEQVGQGGMGVVYRAYDPALDRGVALKLLRARAGVGDTGGTARLAREAQAMARLAHPNVVPVYDVGRTGDSLFVAMEFVDGTTLQAWLTAAPRPWSEVLSVCLQAGRGLEAAHAAGIIHRDFKPANVLVGKDGRARVTDFGLARTSGHVELPSTPVSGSISLDTPLTVAGSVMGTPGYMAPEQYLGQPSTPATDQYAFCATLYEALYGQRPFVGADLQTLACLTQQGAVPSPPKSSSAPAWLFPIIARGLSPNPTQRHPSMQALLELLERDPSVRRRRVVLTGLAAVVSLGVAVGLWLWPTMRASSCHRETEQLANVWNDSARATAEQAFLATKQPFAPLALEFVRSNLDGFMASWVAERHRACDDTLLRQTRTERQLSLRLACLENRRVELQTLATRFQQADVEVVTQAAAAVSRLTKVERCANVELLEQRAALGDGLRHQAELVEQQLSEGRMLVALGRHGDARTVLTAALGAARALDDAQTIGVAALELGSLEREADQYAAARPLLDEALRLALLSHDDPTALRALGLLTSLVGWRQQQPNVALALANVGRGLVSRVNDPVLEALLDEGEGDARWLMDDFDGALTAYQRALELLVRAQGPAGLDVARLHSSIGWIRMERGELSQAQAAYERSRRSREALLGVDHPTLGPTWNELGHLARELDDREAALSGLRRAHELRLRTSGANAQISGRAAVNLVAMLITTRRLDEARELLHTAEVVLAAFPSSQEGLEKVRCRLLLATNELGAALASAKRLESMGDNGGLSTAENDALQGLVLAAQGDDAQAVRTFDTAAAVYERMKATRRQFYVTFMVARADSLARLASKGSRDAAEKAHEAALRLEGNSRLKAQASLQLAKAHLANGAIDRARQLATQAITFAVEPDQQALKAEAEQLVVAHPLE